LSNPTKQNPETTLSIVRVPKPEPRHRATMNEAQGQRRLNAVNIDWRSLPEELFPSILSHLDVKTLLEKKRVCSTWRHACTEAIDAKQPSTTQKAFSTNEELRQAVRKYCGYDNTKSYLQCDPKAMEEIAQTYGYPINKWDVSNVEDLSYIFYNLYIFDEDISSWNVSNATTMRGIFCKARAFNQSLSSWYVSNVTDMSFMFRDASSFSQDLSSWNVSNVMDMDSMFSCATSFNQNISSWDVSNVTNMNYMFYRAASFNQNISNWNISNVDDMCMMFTGASLFNQNLSLWNVSNVSYMNGMFKDATSFDQDVDLWDTWDSSKFLL
jgi:surface protein